MSFLSIFKSKNKTEIKEENLPWYGLPSIYSHIKNNIDPSTGKLKKEGVELPDDKRRFKPGGLKWVSGGIDGAFGHHSGGGREKQIASKICSLIKEISRKDLLSKKIELYNIFKDDNLLDYIDPALKKITNSNISFDPYLHKYAKWLTLESPDRGPIKFGIALLGIIRDKDDLEDILLLGKHEEFTLYSAVAILKIEKNPEKILWELGKSLNGWGKIQIVERLAGTNNPEIKNWMLREGYKNDIMYEYLAYICSVTGNLKEELSKNEIDDELLKSAGELIEALIIGGPAENIDDYKDAVEVVSLYIKHIQNKADDLKQFLVLNTIKDYLENKKADWNKRQKNGWTDDLRSNLSINIHKIISDPKWKEKVEEKKNTKDKMEFYNTDQAAKILNIDLWEIHWKRLNENLEESGLWYNVMKNANNERIDRIIALAEQKIPLDKIATGTSNELGFGSEYNYHRCLDFILGDLGKYPNKGFVFIKTALKSPVTRNRNLAIKVLSKWGKNNWPKEAIELLKQAEKEEQNKETKESLKKLIY